MFFRFCREPALSLSKGRVSRMFHYRKLSQIVFDSSRFPTTILLLPPVSFDSLLN
jgi:hypothetical protein